MTILETLRDHRLFGALSAFRDLETWAAWRAFLAAVYGLPMSAAELETFRARTGRETPRKGGYSEAVAIVGRQSGKTQVAATLAVFEAIQATREPGAETYALLIAQDARAALRTLFRYASAAFEVSEMLRRSVVSQLADSIALENGVTLAAYPCRPACRGAGRGQASGP